MSNLSKERIGRFTSGNIHRLMGNPKKGSDSILSAPALTYIKEKQREKRLSIEMSLEIGTREVTWGTMCEGFVFEHMLDTSYAKVSKDTIVCENEKFCGTPDFLSHETVSDSKCPFTRNSFCNLVEICETATTEFFKEENDEYYWQLVSNSILAKSKYAELIVFMPYASQFLDIIKYIENIDDFELQKDIEWVCRARDSESGLARIPHLPNDSGYKNLYKYRFEVPQEDKLFLLSKIDVAYSKMIQQ